MKDIIQSDIFKNNLPPLPPEDYNDLKEDIRKYGCRDPLLVWAPHNILIDGYHRHEICTELGIPCKVVCMHFNSEEDALFYAYKHQTNRRNLSTHERCELALKFEDQFKEIGKKKMSAGGKKGKENGCTKIDNHDSPAHDSLGEMAKKAGVSRGIMAQAKKVNEKATDDEKDKLKKGEATIGGVYKDIQKREKARKKPVNVNQTQDGMVDRVAFRDIHLRLKPFLGKESTTNTHYIGHHKGWAIAVDDKIAVMVRTGLKYSFAVAPDIIDTLDSDNSQFVKIVEGDGHVKVIFDGDDYSTSKTKPIDKAFTKYLTDIDTVNERLKEPTLPADFINSVARCFSYKRKSRGEAREVSSYREEELVLVAGDSIISTDMWRTSTYEIIIDQPKMYLPLWLAATLEDLHKEDTVTGYTICNGLMYFKLSSGFIVSCKVPKVVEEHFPERQIMEVFDSFHKGEPIPLTTMITDIKRILKDCKGKQDDVIKVRRTDALIKGTLDKDKLTIETVGTEGSVHRSVPCRTKMEYEFIIATVHLEEALKYADTMYVSDGALLFEKGSYRHIIPTCTNRVLDYLIKHES